MNEDSLVRDSDVVGRKDEGDDAKRARGLQVLLRFSRLFHEEAVPGGGDQVQGH